MAITGIVKKRVVPGVNYFKHVSLFPFFVDTMSNIYLRVVL